MALKLTPYVMEEANMSDIKLKTLVYHTVIVYFIHRLGKECDIRQAHPEYIYRSNRKIPISKHVQTSTSR